MNMIAAAYSPNPLWFVARATGMVTLLLFTGAVVLGVVTTGRWSTRVWPRALLASVHRNLSLLSVIFLGVHVAASILDPFAHIQWTDALVPFRAEYRPTWLGLGVVALELAIAVVATSLVRRFIGRATWRIVHWSTYVLWPLALIHGLGTGSDTREWWALAIEAGCLAAFVAALLHRAGVVRVTGLPRRGIVAATGAGLGVLCIWTYAGPLQHDWAQRAGTPVAHAPAIATPLPPSPTALADPASAQIIGTGPSTSLVLVDSRDASIAVTVTPAPDGATRLLTVERNGATVCSGTATVGVTNIVAVCGGITVTLTLAHATDGTQSGTITTSAPLP